MTRIGSLNAEGIQRFAGWLDNPSSIVPREMLFDPKFCSDLEAEYLIDLDKQLGTSYELGLYLHNEVFNEVTEPFALNNDRGMWAWISLALMQNLVRHGGKADGLPLARPHYLDVGPRLGYRLIVRTAWNLVRLHGESAKVALASKSTPWGEMAEQMTSTQEVFVHPSVWPVARLLYMDESGNLRKGATSQRSRKARRDPKSKSGLGGVRRLPRTFKQFDRTYNTREMSATEIIELLPSEYARWRNTP